MKQNYTLSAKKTNFGNSFLWYNEDFNFKKCLYTQRIQF